MPFRPGYYPSNDPSRNIREAGRQVMDAYFAYKQDKRADQRFEQESEDRDLRNALAAVDLESDPRFTFEAPPAREYAGPDHSPEAMIPDRPFAPPQLRPDVKSPLGMAADPRSPGFELPSSVLPPGMPGSYGVGLGDALRDVGPLFESPPEPQVRPGQMVPGMGYSPVAIYPDQPTRPTARPGFRSNETPDPIATIGGRPLYRERGAKAGENPTVALIEAARRGDPRAQARILADPELRTRYRDIMSGYGPEEGPDRESVRMMELYRRMMAGEEGAEEAFAVQYPTEYRSYRTTQPESVESPMLRGSGGRTFPDTPEGREAYLEWERMDGAAGRAPRVTRDQDVDHDFIPGDDAAYARTLMFELLEDYGGDRSALRVELEADLADPETPEEDKTLARMMLNSLLDENNRIHRREIQGTGRSGSGLPTQVLPRGGG